MKKHPEIEKNMNQESKSNYLKEDKIELILKYKNEIYEATQISISIKKMIHELITEENLQKIKDKFISLLSS